MVSVVLDNRAAGVGTDELLENYPSLTREDRMGSRVTRIGFAWERGKVVGQ